MRVSDFLRVQKKSIETTGGGPGEVDPAIDVTSILSEMELNFF